MPCSFAPNGCPMGRERSGSSKASPHGEDIYRHVFGSGGAIEQLEPAVSG